MDTDDLSVETYNAVFKISDKFNHDLTLQFGVLAGICSNDNDYLEKANQLIIQWKKNLDEARIEIFFDKKLPPKANFERVLNDIQTQIEKVKRIPVEQRKFDF